MAGKVSAQTGQLHSLCDINAGLNALIGIQQALMQRERTGRGSAVKVSLFGSAAELMAVP